ncbi:S26 family signal peptidase [Micromonospora sp. NPDC005161]
MLGWLAVAAVLAVATAGLLWARRHLLLVAVVGRSMEPTLRSGDRVLARRLPLARVRPGDVVVVVAPAWMTAGHPTRPDAPGGPGLLIKRAHAVPGDPVPVDRVPLLRQFGERVVPRRGWSCSVTTRRRATTPASAATSLSRTCSGWWSGRACARTDRRRTRRLSTGDGVPPGRGPDATPSPPQQRAVIVLAPALQ